MNMDESSGSPTAGLQSTWRRKLQSFQFTRSNSFNRNRGSPDPQIGRQRLAASSSHCETVSPNPPNPSKVRSRDLRRIATTHELAFLLAIEASRDVRELWNELIDAYIKYSLTITEPDESLGQHAQLVFNSTQSHIARLAKVLDSVKESRNINSSASVVGSDLQYFVPLYNFYNNDKMRFYEILQSECKKRKRGSSYDNVAMYATGDIGAASLFGGLFQSYVRSGDMTCLELEGVFNGKSWTLPKCIFTMENLLSLSLSKNNLKTLPADIGRLTKLRHLKLSQNNLKNDSIPYTLSFCTRLVTLLLDYNALDAVPGFILNLKNLQTLHRHGNQNYFRTTFMWYGCESRERIRTASFTDVDVASNALKCATQVQSLQFWSAKTVIASKANYFSLNNLSEGSKDYISSTYSMFNICAACNNASLLHEQGYFVFTFLNPYLGNTCVPFQHWTCSKDCALAVEVPARKQQVQMAREQQLKYDFQVKMYRSPPHTITEISGSTSSSAAGTSGGGSSSSNLLCGGCSQTARRRRGSPHRSRLHRSRSRCKVM